MALTLKLQTISALESKCQNWVETEPSAQSLLQIQSFGNSGQEDIWFLKFGEEDIHDFSAPSQFCLIPLSCPEAAI